MDSAVGVGIIRLVSRELPMHKVKRLMVAIVDDDYRVLQSLEELLRSAGHDVTPFSSAREFLEFSRTREFDCLISDLGMPEMDGFELHRLLKVNSPKLPVILISGRYQKTDPKVSQIGASAFFKKPFSGRDLLRAVEEAGLRYNESR
jgi:FixJ family two-component response regulator